MTRTVLLVVLFVVQAACALFFVSDIAFSVLGVYPVPLNWNLREVIEIGAAIGLVLGLVFGALALGRSLRDLRRAEARLHRASSAFMEILNTRFEEWRLTPAERDVALFAIKGLSLQDIAMLRNTSEGTVKAQTNAIYRKAGVTGRSQLLSLFIEDMMAGPVTGSPVRVAAKPSTKAEIRVL
jgi:DNA-binding CsgD family transcriptional regulator